MRNVFLSNDPASVGRVRENCEEVTLAGLALVEERQLASCRVVHPGSAKAFKDISLEILENPKLSVFDPSRIGIYKNGVLAGEVWRNFHADPFKLIAHSNGKRYLLCGSDYQGFTVVDLDGEVATHYLPKEAFFGRGWCMAQILSYEKQTNRIKLVGCHWADRYEIRTYDFSVPEAMPWPLFEQRYECDSPLGNRKLQGSLPFTGIRHVQRLRT